MDVQLKFAMSPSYVMAPHQNTFVEVHARHPVVLEAKLKSNEHLGDATNDKLTEEDRRQMCVYVYIYIRSYRYIYI